MRIFSTLLCGLFSVSLMAAPSFNHLIVFGDSLSDNGNLYEYMRHQMPQSPPYYEGRFSNGPTWVELVAQKYAPNSSKDYLMDYAFGGAGVNESEEDDEVGSLFTLRSEVSTYLAAHNSAADPQSLYVVWIGANNYLALPDDVDTAVEQVIEGIRLQTQRLIDSGAKNVLVMNIPDLGAIPLAAEFGEIEKMHEYSTKHNRRLQEAVDALKAVNAAVNWYYYDVETMLNKTMEEPQLYGLTNVTDTCYEAAAQKGDPQMLLRMARSISPMMHSDNCEGYLFFDPVHPSIIAHTILADDIYKLLESGKQYQSPQA